MQPADVKKSPVRGERPPRRTKTPEEAYAALTRLCARAEKSESDALRLMRRGVAAGAALDMGITNKAFDSYEQGLIRDAIAARIPAQLTAAKLFD